MDVRPEIGIAEACAWLEEAFSPDWRLEWLREGIYDLDIPTCKACQAMGGIPSWSAMLVRRAAVR